MQRSQRLVPHFSVPAQSKNLDFLKDMVEKKKYIGEQIDIPRDCWTQKEKIEICNVVASYNCQ